MVQPKPPGLSIGSMGSRSLNMKCREKMSLSRCRLELQQMDSCLKCFGTREATTAAFAVTRSARPEAVSNCVSIKVNLGELRVPGDREPAVREILVDNDRQSLISDMPMLFDWIKMLLPGTDSIAANDLMVANQQRASQFDLQLVALVVDKRTQNLKSSIPDECDSLARIRYRTGSRHPFQRRYTGGRRMIGFEGSYSEPDIILWCVPWYVAYPISHCQLEETMDEGGVGVDHASPNRGVLPTIIVEQDHRAIKRAVDAVIQVFLVSCDHGRTDRSHARNPHRPAESGGKGTSSAAILFVG